MTSPIDEALSQRSRAEEAEAFTDEFIRRSQHVAKMNECVGDALELLEKVGLWNVGITIDAVRTALVEATEAFAKWEA